MNLDDVDLLDLDRFQRMEHHEMFTRLRAEDPVHWTEEADGPGFWSITKHADLQADQPRRRGLQLRRTAASP